MADNITLNSGSGGATLAADDISSVWHQRIKVQYGEDGSATDVSDTNPMPVDDAGGTITVDMPAVTSGGATPYKLISAATTNATSVKASAGQIYGIFATNVNAAARYLKIYNKASAPTVGSDTPVLVLLVPGNTAGAGLSMTLGVGIELTTGIAFALTTGVADSDTGAVAANELVVNLLYQ